MSAVVEVESGAAVAIEPDAQHIAINVEQLVLLRNIRWKTYQRLLTDLAETSHVRVCYDHGDLELMSPQLNHEIFRSSIGGLVQIIALELELNIAEAGSTTLKLKKSQRGAEPDTSFYIEHEALVRGKERIDLRKDPPPEIVFEVDITSSSMDKFAIYASFAVPEFWRYEGGEVRIYWLREGSYRAAAHSLAFSWLTAEKITEYLNRCIEIGQSAALREFSAWLRAEKQHWPA
jgi:Uma2 family endonuclease